LFLLFGQFLESWPTPLQIEQRRRGRAGATTDGLELLEVSLEMAVAGRLPEEDGGIFLFLFFLLVVAVAEAAAGVGSELSCFLFMPTTGTMKRVGWNKGSFAVKVELWR